MKKAIIIFLLITTCCGCNSEKKENKNDYQNYEYKELMNESEYIIIDVRTKEEYEEGHLVGAINIPHDEIDENIKIDKDKNIFVYCRSGNRSKTAYNKLKELGYSVYDLGAFSEIDLPKEA